MLPRVAERLYMQEVAQQISGRMRVQTHISDSVMWPLSWESALE